MRKHTASNESTDVGPLFQPIEDAVSHSQDETPFNLLQLSGKDDAPFVLTTWPQWVITLYQTARDLSNIALYDGFLFVHLTRLLYNVHDSREQL